MVNWLTLDIGGANIKASDGAGYSSHQPFALWRQPQRLAEALAAAISRAPPCDQIAATMTGELADCFATKDDGVRHILQALLIAAGKRPVSIYRIDGKLVAPEDALREPPLVAAANWHALAQFSARFTDGRNSLLIDIGSTTTDIIPIVAGRPQTAGLSDTERLLSGELVYTGVGRSPICAVVRDLPYLGQWCPVAQELFATTQDAYLLLDELPACPENVHTADGRPATREFAHARLARCLCADISIFDLKNAVAAAEAIRDKQTAQISKAVAQVVARQNEPISNVIICGQGEFLARRVVATMEIDRPVISLGEVLGPNVSRCAPAHALAVLAREGSNS
jgi:(4-(4-[2-(gamma-L-glutamylamino)ethyl]phenoxymethyl)furan-2-yl)methanamine synthase